jgi:dihydropyrimidinase
MPLLIRNADIINADSRATADIYVESETITRIGRGLEVSPDTEVIDATGHYVFPGFIDPHVHIYLPFMATFAKDTQQTASIAALIGGTTTWIEMCCPNRHDDALEGYRLWHAKARGSSACDYTFHMAVTKFDDATEGELREIVSDGISSFKIFLAYRNFFGVDDGEMYKTMALARKLGVIVTAHCENAELVAQMQQQLIAQDKTGPEWHEPSRPEFVEAEGTYRFATFLDATGAAGYVVHLSCEPALKMAVRAKERGTRIWIESVIPHLILDKTFAERPGVEGMKHVMSPPLRDPRNHQPLWDALAAGLIDTVATDHCPFDTAQKLLGKDNFTLIPNGIPAIEDRVNLLYTYGVSRGRLDIHRFVDAASTKAAKLFGLFPRKGTVAVGSDADIVIYDHHHRGTISAATHHVNNDYSGFEGFEIDGRPHIVMVRGKVQVRNGKFTGDTKHGQFLRREPCH